MTLAWKMLFENYRYKIIENLAAFKLVKANLFLFLLFVKRTPLFEGLKDQLVEDLVMFIRNRESMGLGISLSKPSLAY
jgi:hypothetical protein